MSTPPAGLRPVAFSPPGPHPTDAGVVGTYVHSYDPPRQHQSPIPGMRPSRDPAGGSSPTPIYDALYSEYLRSFRALPGDRSGEESLSFLTFGPGRIAGRPGSFGHAAAAAQQGRTAAQAGAAGTAGAWQRVGRHAVRPQPAALPPGSRSREP